MSAYFFFLSLIGVAALLSAWLPPLLKGRPISLPMACVALGLGAALIPSGWQPPKPGGDDLLIEKVTELCVLFALTGAGLSLERPLGWREWLLPRRLLTVTMPLTIAAIALMGYFGLGLELASALLLGAVLSPTDPVLASEVQVEGPGDQEEGEEGARAHPVRFGLTAEAGLNDGLAFSFTVLAIGVAAAAPGEWGWLGEWLVKDVIWRIGMAVVVGAAAGWGIARVTFRHVAGQDISRLTVAFVSVGMTLLTYALCESVHSYGFLGVFVAALIVRRSYMEHEFQRDVHELVSQFEHLSMALIMVVFGAMIGSGMLSALTWQGVLLAAAAIFVVRPLAGWLGLLGQDEVTGRERVPIAVLGIRGIGSFYYLAYALHKESFAQADTLWAVVGAVVLGSIVVHGASEPYLTSRLINEPPP